MKKTKSFHSHLITSLKNPIEAAAYLNAVIGKSDVHLLLAALRDIAEAQGGMSALSQKTKLNRANLYKMFSGHGNPRIQNVETVLKVFGLRIGVLPQQPTSHYRKAA
jgi:probable addiction module antidote protein